MSPLPRPTDIDYVSVPLLGYDDHPKEGEHYEDISEASAYRSKSKQPSGTWWTLPNTMITISIFLNLLLAFLYFTDQVSILSSPGPGNKWVSMPNLSSPADGVVTYTTKKFTRGDEDDIPLYDQAPSQEVDDAWYDLYKMAAIGLSEQETSSLPNKTWAIRGNRNQYLITLDVFHQLHCLDILRQFIHGDEYDPATHPDIAHMRHCIGAIRQGLMCNADVTPAVWQWDYKKGWAQQRDDVVHVCRDFGKVRQWAEERWLPHANKTDLVVYQLPGDDEPRLPPTKPEARVLDV